MFKRSHTVIAISIIAVLALSACGGDGEKEATPAEASPEVPVSTAASPTPPTTVNGATPPADQVSLGLAAEELPTVEVVKILAPSIVQIVTESLGMGLFNQPEPSRGLGTGVILDEQGHILTNNHVIATAQSLTVTLSNGDSLPAEIVGADPGTDTAVIRIEAAGLQPAKLGTSSNLQVGEGVIAIGHALGLPGGPTVSKGVVSALGRSIDTDAQTTLLDLIQTDAAINPGNSGGALVNTRGEVIGINTAGARGSQGIGFAINIDDAKVVVAQLILRGYVERGFLGITPINLTPGIANQLGVPVTEGILLVRSLLGTAADSAGLRESDVIVEMGGQPIRNTGELSKFLIDHLPGETVDIVYFRGAERIETQATLGERPTG